METLKAGFMKTLKATYKVVTPLFMGGSDPKTSAELRAPSFKGVLRFWYRATLLAEFKQWQEVYEKEQELFGSTNGRAKFSLTLKTLGEIKLIPQGHVWDRSKYGSLYLGYGLIQREKESKSELTLRPFISPGTKFSVTLAWQKNSEVDINYLKRALIAPALFGGLGSRSRRGFGSICLDSLLYDDVEIWSAPQDIFDLRDSISSFIKELGELSDTLPEYTAFSSLSRVIVLPEKRDAIEMLEHVGREMMSYRSYGTKKNNNKDHELPWPEKANQYFSDDHDLIRQVTVINENQLKLTTHPRRVVFGLPHNYYFSGGNKVDVTAVKSERRASPLFIHLHELANGKCSAVLTILPARFLPNDKKINIKENIKGQKRNGIDVLEKVDFEVLYHFLDRFHNALEVPMQ